MLEKRKNINRQSIINMKKLYAFFLCMACLQCIMGQTMTVSTTMNSDKSIVRKWNDKIVVYNQSGSSRTFNVFDADFTSIQTVSLESTTSVNDFKMSGNILFFCGTRVSAEGVTKACVGRIGLGSLSSKSPSVQYSDVKCLDCDVLFTDARKLDIYKVHDGMNVGITTHVVLVGETEQSEPLTPETGAYLADLYYVYDNPSESTPKWNVWVDLEAWEHFDDVVVTDDYVVAISRKGGTDVLQMRRFEKPSSSSNRPSIFGTGSYKDSVYLLCRNVTALSAPHLVDAGDNQVGVAYYGKNHNNMTEEGICVMTVNIDGRVSIVKEQFDVIPTSSNESHMVKEFGYDPEQERFLLLDQWTEPMVIPIVPSSQVKLYSNTSVNPTSIIVVHPSQRCGIVSIDYLSDSEFISSGKKNNKLAVFKDYPYGTHGHSGCRTWSAESSVLMTGVSIINGGRYPIPATIMTVIGDVIHSSCSITTNAPTIDCNNGGISNTDLY